MGNSGRSDQAVNQALNCVDLFAGAGGFSLAARRAELEVRLAVESDRHAVDTYKANLCKGVRRRPVVLAGDIRPMDPATARRKAYAPDEMCDLLLGGPPCQGFSTHRLNGAGIADERNDLIHVYFAFVRAFAPSVFLMENVPGMLWDRHAETLDRFYMEGACAGYDVQEPVVIDARDFGVPQRRKRVFILGLKRGLSLDGLAWPPKPTHGSPTACAKDATLAPWRNCAHVFAPPAAGDTNDLHMKHGKDLIDAFMRTPLNGGSRRDSGRLLACHAKHDGHKDVYGRIDPSQPAPTMTTACINPSKGRFVHPTLPHGITARQAARIQTFPEDFTFSGGLMAAGVQIGNAVPIELGERLIRHLMPLLRSARFAESAIEEREPEAVSA
ncbi:DNA cytosine methyltransferase [Sphingomonas canadensis]|uniref:Cytosine-specific methyltransferase n=1 Tax=Sphingomonas canadensis TaxID=1219257 RepID=A0ABW3H0T5_9SPHN|nr:DNA cytosine methyltransferase [Sphingomonas canadensis]MCW3835046.1 DNA cytosine methyltransferase [Sphingomonas canadensis]